MDSYICSSSWSSSSSKSLGLSMKPVQSFHSVRKPRPKLRKRTGILSQLPPPKVYRVNSANFRSVVQRLTGVPNLKFQRLKSMAPPPLPLPVPSFRQSDDDITRPILPSARTRRSHNTDHHRWALAAWDVRDTTGDVL